MKLLFITALLGQLPFVAPRSAVEVVNGEPSGYIVAVVDGKDIVKEIEKLVPDRNGTLHSQKVNVVWQAGPRQAIAISRANWTTHDGVLTLFVRYYSDGGELLGVSTARQFTVSSSRSDRARWVFHRTDLIR